MSRHKLDQHHGGWVPQRPDQRDREFLPTAGRVDVAAQEFELPNVDMIPVLDQGQQGSCTGHGTSFLVMFDQLMQKQRLVVPARAMIYFDARIPEHTTDQDSGATVRDAVKGVVKYGVVPDSEFPYDDRVFDRLPSSQAYKDALVQQAVVYEAVSARQVYQAIASGFPVVFGFTVYESFESDEVARTGVVPVPEQGERVLGGHCVAAWGYNSLRSKRGRIPAHTMACRNSWRDDWGAAGNFYLPRWFIDSGNASDFWTIRRLG